MPLSNVQEFPILGSVPGKVGKVVFCGGVGWRKRRVKVRLIWDEDDGFVDVYPRLGEMISAHVITVARPIVAGKNPSVRIGVEFSFLIK